MNNQMLNYSTFDAFKHVSPIDGMIALSDVELSALQQSLVNMLIDITSVLERHEIDWMLAYGSCLGAVRHSGFIPWDDDLDIAIFREDYEKIKLVFNDELGEGYILQDPETTDGYDLAFPRIRKKGTLLKCRDDYFTPDDKCGIYIDVLIYDNVPNGYVARTLQGIGSLIIGFGYSCRRFAKYGDYYLDMVRDDSHTAHVFRNKQLIGRLLSFLSMDSWTRAWYKWNKLYHNNRSKLVSIPSARKHFFGELAKREDLTPTRELTFGVANARVPNNFVSYLTSIYGPDYMVPPPVEEREQHIVLAFDLGKRS